MFIFQKVRLSLISTLSFGALFAGAAISGSVLMPLSLNYKVTFNNIKKTELTNFPSTASNEITFTIGVGEINLFNVYSVKGTTLDEFEGWLKSQTKDLDKMGLIAKIGSEKDKLNKSIKKYVDGDYDGCKSKLNINDLETQYKTLENQVQNSIITKPEDLKKYEEYKEELNFRKGEINYLEPINNSIFKINQSDVMWKSSIPLIIAALLLSIGFFSSLSYFIFYKIKENNFDDDNEIDENMIFSDW